MKLVRTENLGKVFAVGGNRLEALKDISIEISQGEFIGIYGISGSGKTTLLNLIGLLDTPSDGKVFIAEEASTKMNSKEIAKMRNQYFGFLHQSFGLLSDFTILENVEMPLLIQNIDERERKNKCLEILSQVGLEDKVSSYPFQISGGQQQRVALARALVTNPKVILTDEPTGALDSMTGRQIVELLREIAHNGERAVIMVTHDRTYKEMFDRVIELKDGKIVS
ncbi:MAG: ABC transporter ATP-binding protein [Candidatus Heimdallarchaeota archaeon]|nr:ABC transporter ATP-binding protein [Candidatus Heimdallarchaeota archaeon]